MDILRQSYTYGRSQLISTSKSDPYRVFLFGGNVSQSLSPLLHRILFKSVHAGWDFGTVQTTRLSEFKATLTARDTIGTSITMPNKVTFKTGLDYLTEEARIIGAVNTSFVRVAPDGRRVYVGTNTDCVGIRETILQRSPEAVSAAQGKAAMVIGAGGAARSAIYSLWKWFGPSEIYIANRLESEVREICNSLIEAMPGIQLRHVKTVQDAERLAAPYIIVGTIPDYTPTQLGEVLCNRICDVILQKQEKGLLVDMCYMPSPRTKLLSTAKAQGWKTITGREVLVRVCVAQQILWVEEEPDEIGVKQALEAIGEKNPNQVAKL
ncbi:hypothetical protein BDV12DRAFT_206474 [Aspergillus spectabilis]